MSKITIELDWKAEKLLTASALKNNNTIGGELKRLVTLALTGRLPLEPKKETSTFLFKGNRGRKSAPRNRKLRAFKPKRDQA